MGTQRPGLVRLGKFGRQRPHRRPPGPQGAAKWENRPEDQAERKPPEAALTQVKNITVSGAAQQDLQAGRIDGRLLEAIADAAQARPIDIVEFGNLGMGASPDVPLRYADLAISNPAATTRIATYVPLFAPP